MPQLQTQASEQVWASPDGQRVIYKVTMTDGDQLGSFKTYSKAISEVGFSGDVEIYEKPGRNGAEQFVKQVQKEGFTPQHQASPQSSTGQSGSQTTSPKPSYDNFTMYLSYAKDIVVALIAAGEKIGYDDAMAMTAQGGISLYDHRPDAPEKAEVPDEIVPVPEGKQTEIMPSDSELREIFGEKPAENKWNPGS